jgi:hypothetical protein
MEVSAEILPYAVFFRSTLMVVSKPATPSQVSYLRHLLQQVGGAEPEWSSLTDIEASDLIAGLKAKRGKPALLCGPISRRIARS